MTCVALIESSMNISRYVERIASRVKCDMRPCLIALVSPFHGLYKVMDHDEKESCAQIWYLAPAFRIRLRSFVRTPQLCTPCNARTPQQVHDVFSSRTSPPPQGIHHRPPGESRSPPVKICQCWSCAVISSRLFNLPRSNREWSGSA